MRFLLFVGETAATLEALRYCKGREALVMGITNTGGFLLFRLDNLCGAQPALDQGSY